MKTWLIGLLSCACLFTDVAAAQSLETSAHALSASEAHEAQQTVAQGGASAEQLIALYERMGRTAARGGDEETASAAFVRLLALSPSYRLPANESELVRSRYMEARGFWAAHAERLGVAARWSEQGSALIVTVTDPAQLSARVRVRWRKVGRSDYLETVRLPNSQIEVPTGVTADVAELEIALALLDEHGNRLVERGSDGAPERVRIRQAVALEPAPVAAHPAQLYVATNKVAAQPATASSLQRRRLLIASGVSGGVALIAGAGALWAYRLREEQAQRWNRGRCDGTGLTRATLCAEERHRVARWQRVAIGLAATAGAALVGAALFSLLAPAGRERAPGAESSALFHCHAGPGELGLGCTATY